MIYCSIILVIIIVYCPQQVRDAAMRTEMQRVRMRHTAAAPSCLAAVYFHTVGSIPRVTKKSLIDDFQLSTRFSLLSTEWGHCQSVSFWCFRVAELKAKLELQHRFCWHCSVLHMHSRQHSKKVFPLAKKGGFTKAKLLWCSTLNWRCLTLKQSCMLIIETRLAAPQLLLVL